MNGVEFRLLPLVPKLAENKGQELGALALITLTDPQKNGNALDIPLLQSLRRQLQDWRGDNIRAVILRSTSDKIFSVGMDLAAFTSRNATEREAAFLYRSCLDSIYQFPAPVFCLLEGAARAGGVGLALAADIIIASPTASITLGEALFGLIPANVMPYLRQRVSERRANQMVFIPQALEAATLLEWGLVDFIAAGVGKTLQKLLRSVLRCSPRALAQQKVLGRQLGDLKLSEQQCLTEKILCRFLEDAEVAAGINAFLDGSLAPWSAKPPKEL